MKKITFMAAAAASFAIMADAAYAQCMIYSQPNYQGAAGIVQRGDQVLFFNTESSDENTYIDPSWFNNVRSSKTKANCELTLYDKKSSSPVLTRLKGDNPVHASSTVAAVHCGCQ